MELNINSELTFLDKSGDICKDYYALVSKELSIGVSERRKENT